MAFTQSRAERERKVMEDLDDAQSQLIKLCAELLNAAEQSPDARSDWEDRVKAIMLRYNEIVREQSGVSEENWLRFREEKRATGK